MEALWNSCSCPMYSLEDRQKQLGLGDKVGNCIFLNVKFSLALNCFVRQYSMKSMVLSGLDGFDTCYNAISASFTGSALFVLAAVGIKYPQVVVKMLCRLVSLDMLPLGSRCFPNLEGALQVNLCCAPLGKCMTHEVFFLFLTAGNYHLFLRKLLSGGCRACSEVS